MKLEDLQGIVEGMAPVIAEFVRCEVAAQLDSAKQTPPPDPQKAQADAAQAMAALLVKRLRLERRAAA